MACLGISRADKDTAGGLIVGPPKAEKVFVNDYEVALDGAIVTPHGEYQHAAAVMISSTESVFIEDLHPVRETDEATCGHTATGSADVFSGE